MNKIALICNYQLLPERVGGMDYFFWDFDKKCKENNIAVDWFFPNESRHGDYTNLTIYSDLNMSVENLFIQFIKINKSDYTHIITHFVELCTPFFAEVKKHTKGKTIVVDHNPRPLNGYPFKKAIFKKLKGIFFSKYIDVFVGVSDYTVNEIIKDFGTYLKSKTQTIYNGVITDKIQIRSNRSSVKPSFLVASHLRESKGIQDLIAAVNMLPLEIKSNIKIDIYGDGPYKEHLIDKIQSYALENCFVFKGSRPDLNEIFYLYDYMLQPTHMECFSLSILESLAANVPVITTNVGGNEEVVVNGFNGYIFNAKDSNGLKNILEEIYLGNKKIEVNTRLEIENRFSLKKMVNQHFSLLMKN